MTSKSRNKGISRRAFLKASAGTAALLGAAQTQFPFGAHVAQAAGPEVTKATLGFIALTDASPLFVAKEKGIFAKYGMPDVEVAKQASWGATRDNLVLGSEGNGIDGAHILTPMPYLISSGKVTQNNVPTPMYILARLNLDAPGDLGRERIQGPQGRRPTPRRSRPRWTKKKAAGKEVKAAMTFPGGTHDLWIRYWLAAGGIDPDKDIETIVVPPPQMVANMKVGNMDAFCVGEPWNEQLVNQGIGYTACTTGEIWTKHPEKALGMRAAWVDKNPNAAKALLMAVMEAQQWCEKMENKEELADNRRQAAMVQRARSPTSSAALKGDINYGNGRVEKGTKQYMKFWSEHASYPFKSHDEPGSSPRTSAGASSSRRPTSRRWSTRSTARTSGATPPRRCRWPRPTFRPRPRAARRPSSTARCSIRKIRPPTSRASRSSASKCERVRAAFSGRPADFRRRNAMNMPCR